MYSIAYQPSPPKTTLLLLISCLYCCSIYWLLAFYSLHPILYTALLASLSMLSVLKAVGVFAMFPGAFRYYSAQVEKNEQDRLLANLHHDLVCLVGACERVCGGGDSRGFGLADVLDSLRLQRRVIRAGAGAGGKARLLEGYDRLIGEIEAQATGVSVREVISDRV